MGVLSLQVKFVQTKVFKKVMYIHNFSIVKQWHCMLRLLKFKVVEA